MGDKVHLNVGTARRWPFQGRPALNAGIKQHYALNRGPRGFQ